MRVNVTIVDCTGAPVESVAVMVTGNEPVGVDEVVVIFNVDDHDPLLKFAGVNVPTAVAGRPLTEKLPEPAYPFSGVTVAANEVDWPTVIVRLEGVAPREKLGAGSVSPLHDVNLNEAIRVLQLKLPFSCRYSLVNQKVQSSTGSSAMVL